MFGIPIIMGGKQVGALGLYHDITNLVQRPKLEPEIIEPLPEEAPEAVETAEEEGAEEKLFTPEPIQPEEAPPTTARASRRLIPIEKIEGIGRVYASRLAEVGIKTTDDLLNYGKTRTGREELVEKTGISSLLVLKWVNMADLMRIRGIGEEYSELLEKAGVDTVKELRNRNPDNLYAALVKTNETRKLVRRLPNLAEVEAWVREAKESEPIMTY
jgi:predicted flap endonuclease-1-like 5' DNA nuclease